MADDNQRWFGVDTGGTFTDLVRYDGAGLAVQKVLSTPEAPERAILSGAGVLGGCGAGSHVVHGSTVATNAVLEHKGVRTVFITNRGLGDMLTIGRQARRELYNLEPPPVSPPVQEALCLETGGRLAPDGSVIEPLTEQDLAVLTDRVTELAPAAVAINLLYAFLDDTMERRIEAVMPPAMFVSRSSDVLPEYREYERGVATWLNAYVGPLVRGYLERLAAGVAPAPVHVMQSSGGTISADQAARRSVHLLLSGPAGGLMGARFAGRAAGREQLLTLDMGGTSTDVALLDGEVGLTTEGRIGPYPVVVPMVDMHTIGAGGGSVVRVDAGGLLQVGPRSAGAAPGPACYGRGGVEPTVTDANVVLGRLPPSATLAGGLPLDATAARNALATTVAGPLGLTVEEAAHGVIRVANEEMARALRVISVQRGVDPRGFTLMSFGGAGGLHVCALADALNMGRAMVPVHAGVLSALGMLVAPRGRQLSATMNRSLAAVDVTEIDGAFATLQAKGRDELTAEGVDPGEIDVHRGLELRYRGQSFTLEIPWRGLAAAEAGFHAAHEGRYGHRLDVPVELVNLRVGLAARPPALTLTEVPGGPAADPAANAVLHGFEDPVPVWRRDRLVRGQRITGPGLILEASATTFVAPGWTAEVDRWGNLLLDHNAARGPV